MIGEINTKPQAGGVDIQGVIEQYQVQAGQNVNAGDFVKFISETPSLTTPTRIASDSFGYLFMNAILLDNNRIFIKYTNDSNSTYLLAVICTISGNTITLSTPTTLLTNQYSASSSTAIKLSNSKIFIVHYSSSQLFGMICTINGNSITINSDTLITSANCSSQDVGGRYNVCFLTENKLLIDYLYNSKRYLITCIISGNSITAIGNSNLYFEYSTSQTRLITANDVNHYALLIYKMDSKNYYRGRLIFNDNNTSITLGTETKLYNQMIGSCTLSLTKIEEDKIFVAHTNDSDSFAGMICRTNNSVITAGNSIVLGATGGGYHATSSLIDTNLVLVTHRGGKYSRYIFAQIFKINGDDIVEEQYFDIDTTQSSGSDFDCHCVINKNKIFILYQRSYYPYGLICNISKFIKTITTSGEEIAGVSIEDGTSNDVIDIYVPNTN